MIAILPMAGRGRRFADRGFEIPKPLIDVAEKPMFAWALQSLEGLHLSRLIVVALQEHEEHFGLSTLFRQYSNISAPVDFVFLPDVTEGQLCTVMAAEDYFVAEQPMIVIASDTLVLGPLPEDIELLPEGSAGLISVADLPGDRWSFARTNDDGRVLEVAEKVRISSHASTGIYYFSRCEIFRHYSRQILDNQEKTKGEYYVIPVYQKMINDGQWVGISQAREMWDMGTPEAMEAFEKHLK
jgi:dTDP-glucose pyrophosphorylase